MTYLIRILVIGGFSMILIVIGCRCIFFTQSVQKNRNRYYEAEAKRCPWLSFLKPSPEFIMSRYNFFTIRIVGFALVIMGLLVLLLLFVKK
jgi:hypothetical protein